MKEKNFVAVEHVTRAKLAIEALASIDLNPEDKKSARLHAHIEKASDEISKLIDKLMDTIDVKQAKAK